MPRNAAHYAETDHQSTLIQAPPRHIPSVRSWAPLYFFTPTERPMSIRRHRFDVARRHFRVSLIAGAVAAALAAVPTAAGQHRESGIPVSNCNDSGAGSLRDALAIAVEGDLVAFDANLGCNLVSLTSGALVIAGGADGNPIRHITIAGPGKAALSIDAQALDRVFEHHAGVDAELTLRDLTVTGGRTGGSGGCVFAEGGVTLDRVDVNACTAGVVSGDATFGTGPIRGGAIYSGTTVTLSNAHLVGNHAYGYTGSAYGGAIFAKASIVADASEVRANFVFSPGAGAYGGGLAAGDHGANAQATVTLTSSDVLQNTADSRCSFCGARGGGIWTYGNASITGGTTGGNTAFSTYGYGTGGGVYFFGAGPVTLTVVGANVSGNTGDTGGGIAASGDLSIERVLLDGNVANADGGSLALIGGNLTMTDSVIGDCAAYRGAGLFIFGYGDATITNSTIGRTIASYGGAIANTYGTLHIANSTISDNDAGHGGGIYFRYPYYAIDVTSSIIAGNRGINGPDDIWPPGMTVTGSHDLITAADGVTLPDDTLRGDPLLGSLDNYGGPTLTMPPDPGSPAIDAGSNPLGLAFDQRGDGFPRENGGGVDIGAFETPPGTLTDRIFESDFDP